MSAETWEQSYAIKYINYEAEPGHVNLENPLQMTEANERRVRSYKKGKNKKKGKDGEFSVTEEGITEVVGKLALKHAVKIRFGPSRSQSHRNFAG